MKRFDDWRRRLVAFLVEHEGRPVEYGTSDCALFAADAVKEITGEDFGAPYRGTYSTAAGAAKALRKSGYSDLAELAAATFPDEVLPSFGQTGDLAVVKGEDGPALGIVSGMWVVTAYGRVPVSAALKVYKV